MYIINFYKLTADFYFFKLFRIEFSMASCTCNLCNDITNLNNNYV